MRPVLTQILGHRGKTGSNDLPCSSAKGGPCSSGWAIAFCVDKDTKLHRAIGCTFPPLVGVSTAIFDEGPVFVVCIQFPDLEVPFFFALC